MNSKKIAIVNHLLKSIDQSLCFAQGNMGEYIKQVKIFDHILAEKMSNIIKGLDSSIETTGFISDILESDL